MAIKYRDDVKEDFMTHLCLEHKFDILETPN